MTAGAPALPFHALCLGQVPLASDANGAPLSMAAGGCSIHRSECGMPCGTTPKTPLYPVASPAAEALSCLS